jgi:hypothetical protein
MFVRVYDQRRKKYYKSIVYGIIDIGYYERHIVFNPVEEAYELVDYLNKNTKELPTPLVEVISSDQEEWVTYDKVKLLKFKNYCKNKGYQISIDIFYGYDEVFQDFEFMLQLFEKKKVDKDKCCIQLKEPKDINHWRYIKTQRDANYFMELFAGFHDSTIDKMEYLEDYSQRTLNVTFNNSCWYGIAELCFEGLVSMNLRPQQENHSREIFGGCLFVNDESIFWADECLDKEDMKYTGSYIKALNLKWRKIGC